MIRLIAYVIIAFFAYLVIRFFQSAGRAMRPPSPPPGRTISGTMVKDEACGTYIPQETAIRELVDGEEMYFCSKVCREKFLKERK